MNAPCAQVGVMDTASFTRECNRAVGSPHTDPDGHVWLILFKGPGIFHPSVMPQFQGNRDAQIPLHPHE